MKERKWGKCDRVATPREILVAMPPHRARGLGQGLGDRSGGALLEVKKSSAAVFEWWRGRRGPKVGQAFSFSGGGVRSSHSANGIHAFLAVFLAVPCGAVPEGKKALHRQLLLLLCFGALTCYTAPSPST